MPDWTKHEEAALEEASANGGEYLESIKKTDLATLTPEEWGLFVESIVIGFCDGMRKAEATGEAPF